MNSMKYLLSLLLCLFLFSPLPSLADSFCEQPLTDDAIPAHFKKLARKQLILEFGDTDLKIGELIHSPVGRDMVRVEGYATFRKPARVDRTSLHLTGWISRCRGTVIVRGNTWLADGRLDTPRYTLKQLPGKGISLGKPDAPTRVIAYVDSRCPQCHRLLDYARELTKDGKMHIEIRQVAFLETHPEAVIDTRLLETSLVTGKKAAKTNDNDYLDMLSGLLNDSRVDERSAAFRRALDIIELNTRTARNILHLTSTPGVLVQDEPKLGYRMTGYWEMNRLFQPDL
jgi:hypothetical protein